MTVICDRPLAKGVQDNYAKWTSNTLQRAEDEVQAIRLAPGRRKRANWAKM